VPELETEDVSGDKEWHQRQREHTRKLNEEFKSFERKRIDRSELVFILLKLSAVILDENRC
jgi:hypothetical protein